jgi:hypothetical protein
MAGTSPAMTMGDLRVYSATRRLRGDVYEAGFGAVGAVLGGAVALVWFVPEVADRIVQNGMKRQIANAASAPYLTDDVLHILLCGTGSPMPDMTGPKPAPR